MMNGSIRIPPDGAGKRVQTMQNIIDGETVQTQVVSLVGANNPEQGQYIDEKGSAYIRFGEGQPALDPFARFKVVQSNIIGVYEFSVNDYGDLFNERIVGEAESTYEDSTASVAISTSTAAGSSIIKQTNRYHYYQIGTSVFASIICAAGDHGTEGNIRNWGYYDDNNGLFFHLDGTSLDIVIRSSISGNIVDNHFTQSEWNVDKLDGTGLSGFTIDVTKPIRYWINVSHPGGISRFGVFDGDIRIKCHEVKNTQSSYPCMQTMSLPIRYESYNTTMTSSESLIRMFAAVVIAEGDPCYTFWRYSGMGNDKKPVTENTLLFSVKSREILTNGKMNTIQSYPEILSVYCKGGPAKISTYWVDVALLDAGGATWALDNGSTTLCDNASTAVIDTSNAWIAGTKFFVEGITNLNIADGYEINDEGICRMGDTDGYALCWVASKLNAEDTIEVAVELSTRELW
jgi:hypothetical protein